MLYEYKIKNGDFSDSYRNHQIVKSIFKVGENDILIFRSNKDNIYVRTNAIPDNSSGRLMIKPVTKQHRIVTGAKMQFFINLSLYKRKDGKKIAFEGDLNDYVMQKMQDKGFNVVKIHQTQRGELLTKRKNVKLRFDYVSVHGVLEITNPDLFKNTLATGIGRDKMVGLGMLNI